MDRPVTLANWRTSPHNRWAFHHVRELIPTADIPHDRCGVRELAAAETNFDGLKIEPDAGEAMGLEGFLEETDTDGFIVVHRGRVLVERYAHGMTPQTPHILMSVSKSMLGLLFGKLNLDPARQVTDILPELKDSAYRGASLRHLLDMRAGIRFEEDYLATSGPIVLYRAATGWNPPSSDAPSDLHAFYSVLKEQEGRHGGSFHYVSPNTDLLGWVIERATGRRYAELMSEQLWKPIGAEYPAYITVDRLGSPRTAGGMCTTLRDLARVGLHMIEQPGDWVRDIESQGDAAAWASGDLRQYFPGLPMRYRSKWYVVDGDAPLAFGFGIHGQNLFVDRKNELVIAKFSSQALPLDAARISLTMRAVSEIRKVLA